jgi:hypothetical protein
MYKISDAPTKDPTAWRQGTHCIMKVVGSNKVMKDHVMKTVTWSGKFNAKTKARKEDLREYD